VSDAPKAIGGIWRTIRRLAEIRRGARSYDWVITWQDGFATFWFGAVRRLLGPRAPRHAVIEFLTRERGPSLYDRMKYAFMRFALGRVDLVVCSARAEIAYYIEHLGLRPGQTAYVPLYGDPQWLNESAAAASEPFVLSAGRTLRDYDTLLTAIEGTGLQLVVVTSPRCMARAEVPQGVELVYDVPQEELLDLMKRARLVALPLQDTAISAGQRVLVMAMALGKCCIASRTAGTIDYVSDGEDGVLVAPHDPAALRARIEELWRDPDRADRIGARARERYASQHVPEQYAAAVLRHLGGA
jgi:glycosyltransferase involved in cell wall biosynthesis